MGTFSYFPTTKPTESDLNDPNDVYIITPTHWNPHSDSYARNEESMIGWEGEMVQPKDRVQVVLDDIPEDEAMVSSLLLCNKEEDVIDSMVADDSPSDDDDEDSFAGALSKRAEIGNFKMSIGSTTASDATYLTVPSDDEWSTSSEEEVESTWTDLEEDIDAYLSSATASFATGVTPEHLSKVWRISHKEAKRTIDVTSQGSVRPKGPNMSRNYSTNDRMLRYKRIKDYFFMDTFFATKKGGKSSRGHTCCQLFVTDKGFIYVVPMKRKGEVLQAMKQFAKEIGAPEAFVADMSGEQMSKEVKTFCTEIGTTLRALEEGTPWANKAELYIGLIKEAVRKDMKESNSPMVFWDYCLERRARIHNLTAKPNFKLHGTNAHTQTLLEEGDISSLCQFGWYQWCYYREHTAKFPNQQEVLGRVLGPARGEGNEMAQWILKGNGKVVP
jgi:hypothetical protein